MAADENPTPGSWGLEDEAHRTPNYNQKKKKNIFLYIIFPKNSVVRASLRTERQRYRKENINMTEIHLKQGGTAERTSNIDESRCKIHLCVRPFLKSNTENIKFISP